MSALQIKIGGLTIIAHGYQFPDNNDYWDGNWLVIDAWFEGAGKELGLSGRPCLRVPELEKFSHDLKKLNKPCSNTVRLRTLEPYLGIEVERDAANAHISVNAMIKHEARSDENPFRFDCDLSDVDVWISQIDAVVKAFPQKGSIPNVH